MILSNFRTRTLKSRIATLKLYSDVLPSDAASFFLKLNADFESIDGDLAVGASVTGGPAIVPTAVTTTPLGGIDGILIQKQLATAGATADGNAVLADAALLKVNDGLIQGGNTAADPIHVYLKLETLSAKLHGEVKESETQFHKIEKAFVAVAPSDLSEPVAALDSDIINLDGDTARMNPHAIDAFIKFEADFIKGENSFIKREDAFLLKYGSALPPGAADYFIKIDGDYIKVNTDLGNLDSALIGFLTPPPPITASAVVIGGGVANLPTDVSNEIQDKWMPMLSDFNSDLQADIQSLTPPTIGVAATAAVVIPGAVDAFLKFEEIKFKEAIDIVTLDFAFIKFKADLLKGDTDRALVDTLAMDLFTLTKGALGIPRSTGGSTTANA
jgi:hypothetical protein